MRLRVRVHVRACVSVRVRVCGVCTCVWYVHVCACARGCAWACVWACVGVGWWVGVRGGREVARVVVQKVTSVTPPHSYHLQLCIVWDSYPPHLEQIGDARFLAQGLEIVD